MIHLNLISLNFPNDESLLTTTISAARGCDGVIFSLVEALLEAGIVTVSQAGQTITGGKILLKAWKVKVEHGTAIRRPLCRLPLGMGGQRKRATMAFRVCEFWKKMMRLVYSDGKSRDSRLSTSLALEMEISNHYHRYFDAKRKIYTEHSLRHDTLTG